MTLRESIRVLAAAAASTHLTSNSSAGAGDSSSMSPEEESFWMEYSREMQSELRSRLVIAASCTKIIGSTAGILGCLWLLYMYLYRGLLRNTTGLFIAIIAFLDIVGSSYYIQQAVRDLPVFSSWFRDNFEFEFLFEVLMSWSLITYSLMGMLLAFNTLYVVRYSGAASFLDKYRWLAIFVCLIFPLFAYFIPLHFMIHAAIFDINPACVYSPVNPCTGAKMTSSLLLISIIGLAVLLTLYSYCLVLWSLRESKSIRTQRLAGNPGARSPQKSYMISLLKQLGKVFSFCILLMWVPYIVRFIIMNIIESGAYDEKHFLSFDAVTLIIFLRNLCMPMRGYFHALSVLYVFKTSFKMDRQSSRIWQYIKFLFLMSPIASREELIARYLAKSVSSTTDHGAGVGMETAKTISQPHWTINEEGTINVCNTPVVEKKFRFSLASAASSVLDQHDEQYAADHLDVIEEGRETL